MKLIIGKQNIERYENVERSLENDSMDSCEITFLWKDIKGNIVPAIIVYELSDFNEIIRS